MANFLQSTEVHIFPSANRPFEPQARLTSEQNIVGILKNITSNNDYVISQSIPIDVSNDAEIEFIVQGYYFKA